MKDHQTNKNDSLTKEDLINHVQEILTSAKDSFKLATGQLYPVDATPLINAAKSRGWQSLDYGVDYQDQSKGLLVRLSKENDQYDNGIYLLHQFNPDPKTGKAPLMLEVVIPNSRDKSKLIKKTIDQITNFIDGLDTSDLRVFDYNQIFAYVIANAVVKPLAKEYFPGDLAKRARFQVMYMIRFLSDTASFYGGQDDIQEELINASPYTIKMLIDQYSDKDLEKLAKKAQKEAIDRAKALKQKDGDH